ncbi:MAG: dihydroorotase [bacterium]|nr:MAG: dihydroorotase [bacterium]
MKNKNLKILKNVFISSGLNRLNLVDLIFDEQIEKIVPQLNQSIKWQDISTREKWEKFKQNISPKQYSADAKVYDGRHLLLMPGAIDSHVHFNTPGFEDRDDFEHGSLAAACGGVTTVIDMPCTSLPPVTLIENLKIKMKAIEGRSWIDYTFWGGVSGNDFQMWKRIDQNIQDLSDMGVVGFKCYFVSGMYTFTDLTFEQMSKVAGIIGLNEGILAVHAEDKALVLQRQMAFQNTGLNNWQAYCQARDDIAEGKAVTHIIEIARRTDAQIHIVHLSSKLALEQIMKAHDEGLKITTETCPHYLYFTENDFRNEAISNYLKTAPPVKTEQDREALWHGLKDKTISYVTTDHAGCDPIREKSSWNFWDVYGGIPGVEHRVPFLFSEGFKKGRLTLSRTIDLLSNNVAKFFKLDSKGGLTVGNHADLALINLWDKQIVKSENMHSKGKYTPFEGVTFEAVVDSTFLRGKMIADRSGNSEVNFGYGKPVFVK